MRPRPHAGTRGPRRHGFTLVELMVSLALIVFIMSILSYAFSEASGLFRNMKSSGDMAEKLRSAMIIIRRDVSSYHFDGRRRLSDTNFWTIENGPPLAGYFRVWHGGPSTLEGNDVDGIPSYRSTNHMLACTVQLSGNQRSDYFSAFAPSNSPLLDPSNYTLLGWPETRYQDTPNTFNSQTAEVAYFLRQQPDVTAGTPTQPSIPLFTLYRRQWLTIPTNTNGNGPVVLNPSTSNPPVPWPIPFQTTGMSQDRNPDPNNPSNFYYMEMSCKVDPKNPANMYFNSMPDLAIPPRRYGMNPPASVPPVITTDPNLAGKPSMADSVNNNPTYPILADERQPVGTNPALNFIDSNGTTWPNAFPGGDALVTDVISFDVRLLVQGGVKFEDLYSLTAPPPNTVTYRGAGVTNYYPVGNVFFNNLNPQTGLQNGPLVFDTWYGQKSWDGTYDYTTWAAPNTYASIPIYKDNNGNPIRVLAVQITLRIWDLKTQKARQVSLVQEL